MTIKKLISFLFVFVAAPFSVNAQPIAHWALDENSGRVARDTAGGYDGALFGGASFVSGGVSKNALQLSVATDDYVSFGTQFPTFEGESFTIAFWLKTTTSSNSAFPIAKCVEGSASGYFFGVNKGGASNEFGATGMPFFAVSPQTRREVVANTRVTDGLWHHVIGQYDFAKSLSIYVDGEPIEGVVSASNVVANDAPFSLGAIIRGSSLVSTYDGMLDDVQVYDRVLTTEERQDLFSTPGSIIGEIIPPSLTPETEITAPPIISVKSRKITAVLPRFDQILDASAVYGRRAVLPADGGTLSVRYSLNIKRGRSTVARLTSKKNALSMRRLQPGNYSATYRIAAVKNGKVAFMTNRSPAGTFTIAN